ncbi:Protein of unknown function [Cryobacterium psychrotolerans]|uniref:Uncharacterized protein n=1 Tax=Cryobacterium psychrotolerans TaxID=386301 RepID=A0A1G9G7J7_9MICO|nr:DUF3105 domain-containing protein [Cryobacterium sp. TMT1-2-1]TFD83847.1 DUF3105 domain-containing protein [Cryobacterium psychrotolerans]SDK96541.1 Protein of unknown function [Cryobacterium psychrotolerans]
MRSDRIEVHRERPIVTPAPPSATPPNASAASVKQQRAAQRAKKLEEYHRQQKRSARRRRIWLIAGIAAALAVITIVVLSVVMTPQKAPDATYKPGSEGASIEGVETFKNPAGHVETPVDYPETPPTGGEHSATWLNCGVYTEPVPNENAVHALEHGAIWVTYDPTISKAELESLRLQVPSTFVVLSPADDLPSPIVLSGWNAQLQLDSASDKRIPAFFEEYWQGGLAPEIGAPCTGGIDAPGKVS